jgi:hypothetical protein
MVEEACIYMQRREACDHMEICVHWKHVYSPPMPAVP